MIFWIIFAEIAFWIAILCGLFARYIKNSKKLSNIFLFSTPFIDLALLILTAIDLKNGAQASVAHGIAAIYIGISIAFGKSMIEWADDKFQSIILKRESKRKVLYGLEKGIYEMKMWARHFLAYVIGSSLLMAMILYIGGGKFTQENTSALLRVFYIWTVVLGIDFLISFSYIIFPKRKPTKFPS